MLPSEAASAGDSPAQNHPRGGEGYEAPVPGGALGPVMSAVAEVDVVLVARAHWTGRALAAGTSVERDSGWLVLVCLDGRLALRRVEQQVMQRAQAKCQESEETSDGCSLAGERRARDGILYVLQVRLSCTWRLESAWLAVQVASVRQSADQAEAGARQRSSEQLGTG